MPTETDDERAQGRRGERIAKLLARAGVASRREIERMIAEGRVARDGVALDTPATLLTSLHGITVDGQPVAAPAPARLFLYHKPAGLLVTERDPAGRTTIYDRLPRDLPRVVPVGRLDLATEGLLLLTTDGGLKRQLELPATGVERTYRARTYGDITQARLEELIDGIEIDGIRYGSIDANMERRTGANGWIELTLTEGKNREVRRVLEHLGLQVSRLIRTRYGPFVLGELMPGEVGEARQADLVGFRRALEGKRPKTDERVSVAARTVAAPKPQAAEPDRPLRPRPARGPGARAAPEKAATPAPDRAPRPPSPRAAKSAAGWGTRARPSRPAAGAAKPEDDTRPTPRRTREGGDPSRVGRTRDGQPGRDAPRAPNPRPSSPRAGKVDARPRGGDGVGKRPAPSRPTPTGSRPSRPGKPPRKPR